MSYPWVSERGPGQVAWEPGSGGSFGSNSAAVEARIKDLPHQIDDERIERDKPGHRGFFMSELRGILAACDAGDPDDPRWLEIRMRCLDRMAKLLRVYEADAPTVKAGPGDARILADQAARQLDALEASLAETRSS